MCERWATERAAEASTTVSAFVKRGALPRGHKRAAVGSEQTALNTDGDGEEGADEDVTDLLFLFFNTYAKAWGPRHMGQKNAPLCWGRKTVCGWYTFSVLATVQPRKRAHN